VRSFPSGVRLAGDGVVLREWTEDDVPAMIASFDEPLVARYTTIPSPFTAETAADFLAKIPVNRAGQKAVELAIETDLCPVAGSILLFRVPDEPLSIELGYTVDKTQRGQGLAGRAVAVMTDFAYELGFTRVQLNIEVTNVASQSVARKAGYHLVDAPPVTRALKGQPRPFGTWLHRT
jgi:RimJ/RimL family protein N-acetyltransferase